MGAGKVAGTKTDQTGQPEDRMMNAKAKRIVKRLEQIKESAAQTNAATKTKAGITGHDLAEEAASLGLELATLLTKEK
jgi:F0F1-type ATP synthase assembly protein I